MEANSPEMFACLIMFDMGVSKKMGGLPTMVFFRENPNLKWMMTGGTPMTQETPLDVCIQANK